MGIDETLIQEIIRRILTVAEPDKIILFGSAAEGKMTRDSDIDLLVLLRPMLSFGKDLKMCIHALYPLVLELDRPIDSMPVDAAVYEAQEFSLYRNAKREGVPV